MRLIVALITILVAAPALAAGGVNDAAAKKHFEDGTAAFNLGDFKKAVEEYKAAYQLRHDAVFLYNIAQSYRQANDLQNALFFYKSYLRNSPNAPNKAEVERRIEMIDKEIAHQKEMATAPPNGTVTPTGETPPETTPAATEPATTAATTTPPARESDRTPITKKWWLWTAVGGVVVVGVALGVGLGVGLNQGNGAPGSHFGTSTSFLVAP